MEQFYKDIIDSLLDLQCIRFGTFTLKSGIQSPIYIDLRKLISDPELLEKIAIAYSRILQFIKYDRLAAIPYTALPIGTAISIHNKKPLLYPRKEIKTYGTAAIVEGVYNAGEKVVVIDDIATTGGAKFEAIAKLAVEGLIVEHIVVLIDRQSGADKSLKESGYTLHSVFKLDELLDYIETTNRISEKDILDARYFLHNQELHDVFYNTPNHI